MVKKTPPKTYNWNIEVAEDKLKFFPWITYNKRLIFVQTEEKNGLKVTLPPGWTKQTKIIEDAG